MLGRDGGCSVGTAPRTRWTNGRLLQARGPRMAGLAWPGGGGREACPETGPSLPAPRGSAMAMGSSAAADARKAG